MAHNADDLRDFFWGNTVSVFNPPTSAEGLSVCVGESVPSGGFKCVMSKYLQVELQTQPPLLQDFGNPVSDVFGRDLRRFYALL